MPLSTGGLEGTFRCELERRLADRHGVFTNRERLTRLLYLMTLDMLERADERKWAHSVRVWLIARHGRPPAVRQIRDTERTSSLRFSGRR